MIPVFYGVAYQLRDTIRAEVGGGRGIIDVVRASGYGVIRRAGLGQSFAAFDHKEDGYVKTVKDSM
jgi:hypothetical protein